MIFQCKRNHCTACCAIIAHRISKILANFVCSQNNYPTIKNPNFSFLKKKICIKIAQIIMNVLYFSILEQQLTIFARQCFSLKLLFSRTVASMYKMEQKPIYPLFSIIIFVFFFLFNHQRLTNQNCIFCIQKF